MNPLEKRIRNKILAALGTDRLEEMTPGFVLNVYHNGKKRVDMSMGRTYLFYDLASLTKIIFTLPMVMRLVEDKKINIHHPLNNYLSWFKNDQIKLKQILNHSAGLPWWVPFYKKMHGPLDPVERFHQLEKRLKKIRPKLSKTAVYSDLDFLLLGSLLQTNAESCLLSLWYDYLESLDIRFCRLHFNVKNIPTYQRSLYAPTERCPWRKRVLQGEVHDENSWALGGVAPHAGLFGSISDVSRWGLLVRQSYIFSQGSSLIGQKIMRKFSRRSLSREMGDWGLGWMLPSKGKASCGKYFSSISFGHTGFTGTSFWFDPKRDLLVVILSNRVHPTRENTRFVSFRPQLHNWVVESLEEE